MVPPSSEVSPSSPSSSPLASNSNDISSVTVHPLVLLSAADHYHRVARGTRKRVVGVLLGQVHRGVVDATNSFAVPFEEDARNPHVFYLDHNYLESMLGMFRKINAKERVVGFYSTGPQIRPNDLRIHGMMRRFLPTPAANATTTVTSSDAASAAEEKKDDSTAAAAGATDEDSKGVTTTFSPPPPVFVIIDVRPDRPSIPTTAYRVIEEVDTNTDTGGSEVRKNFAHVPSVIGAMEAEEVGVEHLLRDINDPTVSTVANLVKAKMSGLASLAEKLSEMKDYLEAVLDGRIAKGKVNLTVVNQMQRIWNLLPNLNVDELVKSLLVKTNDMYLVIYVSALIRTVIALHDLVNNKIQYMESEEGGAGDLAGTANSDKEKKDDKEKPKDDDKKKGDDTKEDKAVSKDGDKKK